MLRRIRPYLAAATLATLPLLAACSGDSGNNSNNNGGGGGGAREFVSGTISPGGSYSHTFNTARTMNYYCRFHGGPGRVGMSASITVTATGTPDSREVSITANSLPNLTIAKGSTVRWSNDDNVPHTVESDD